MDWGRKDVREGYHDRYTKGNCTCPVCRRRDFTKEVQKENKRIIKDNEALIDIPLFCRVFPEGIVGFCGFRFDGWCAVFEDGCVRWNEFGDRRDYSVGKESPFR